MVFVSDEGGYALSLQPTAHDVSHSWLEVGRNGYKHGHGCRLYGSLQRSGRGEILLPAQHHVARWKKVVIE